MERRRHPRVAWDQRHATPVLEVQEPDARWRPVECRLVDLAAGGVGLLAAEALEPGSRVRLTFALPHDVGFEAAPWSADAEVVHTRPVLAEAPGDGVGHAPLAAHLPHAHGVRFAALAGDAELRLLGALYGPLPAGWGVERYTVRRAAPAPGAPAEVAGARPTAVAGRARVRPAAPAERYAVIRNGKRVVSGFSSYDRARTRAWSLHMDELALAARRHKAMAGGA